MNTASRVHLNPRAGGVNVSLRNPTVAPVQANMPSTAQTDMAPMSPPTSAPVMPRQMPAAIAAARGGVPVQAPPQQNMAPVAYAMSKYQEAGDPFTAAAQGMIYSQQYREEQASEDAKREEAAKLLGDHVDLKEAVAKGVLPIADAATMAQQRDELAAKSERRTQILDYLKAAGYDDVAAQFESGVIDEKGVSDLINAKDSATGGPPKVEERFNETTGQVEKVQWDEATKAWVPFGGQKSTVKSPGDLSAGEKKELFDAQDAVAAGEYVLSALDQAIDLNQKAYEGPFSELRGGAAALVGIPGGVETSFLKNLTTELALTQLKTVFGGMPTEGERKILIEMQGSVDQPKAVRDQIYRRAKVMAERRIADQKAKAEGIRTGDYKQPGYDPGGDISGATDTAGAGSDGIPRSDSVRAWTPDEASRAAQPQSQEEFDALPDGTLYIDPDDNQLHWKL